MAALRYTEAFTNSCSWTLYSKEEARLVVRTVKRVTRESSLNTVHKLYIKVGCNVHSILWPTGGISCLEVSVNMSMLLTSSITSVNTFLVASVIRLKAYLIQHDGLDYNRQPKVEKALGQFSWALAKRAYCLFLGCFFHQH